MDGEKTEEQLVVYNQEKDLKYTWICNPLPGYTPQGILGKTDTELLLPEDEAHLVQIRRWISSGRLGSAWRSLPPASYWRAARTARRAFHERAPASNAPISPPTASGAAPWGVCYLRERPHCDDGSFLEMLGYAREELLKLSLVDIEAVETPQDVA